jgi:hypothetical protein
MLVYIQWKQLCAGLKYINSVESVGWFTVYEFIAAMCWFSVFKSCTSGVLVYSLEWFLYPPYAGLQWKQLCAGLQCINSEALVGWFTVYCICSRGVLAFSVSILLQCDMYEFCSSCLADLQCMHPVAGVCVWVYSVCWFPLLVETCWIFLLGID